MDRLVGTDGVLTAVGMIIGAALGTYLIYLRFGRDDDARR
jgi:hypothetical protein